MRIPRENLLNKTGDATPDGRYVTPYKVRIQKLHSIIRVGLHQASASTLRQLWDDASNSVLIENNGVAPEWGCNPFSSDSIVFNKNRIANIIAQVSLTLGVNGLKYVDVWGASNYSSM